MSVDDMLRRVLRAPVYDVAQETPLEVAEQLSSRLGSTVLLKREDLQPVFSFKLRGAYNRMFQLTSTERAAGVIASSAGNHAQGVALAAARLNIDALIVMPRTTPPIKVRAVDRLGARTVLHGDAYDDAYAHARALAEETGRVFIHPYDDPDVIAGQGTIALEILRQQPAPLDALFVCVGGGGLIAGVSAIFSRVSPETKVIGVEPTDAACLTAALREGRRVRLPEVGIFADGVAVAQVGEHPFAIARECVDEMITVDIDEICAAIKDIFTDTRSIAEPAGALGVAGAKKWLGQHAKRDLLVAATVSGANLNFDRLRHIAERTELGEGREVLLAATIPERPGSFKAFCRGLGGRNITEFNYRYSGPGEAHVFVGLSLGEGTAEKASLLEELGRAGIPVEDLSDDEMAKLHLRHLVGGRVAGLENERLYRFEFPERPGALGEFLDRMSGEWNISLFHYRNHGAAFGRVLAGVQVPEDELSRWEAVLEEIGYAYVREEDNPAYALFLKAPRHPRPLASPREPSRLDGPAAPPR